MTARAMVPAVDDLITRWRARAQQLRPFGAEGVAHTLELAAEELAQALARTDVTSAAPCPSCAAASGIGGIAALGSRSAKTTPGQEPLVCPTCRRAPAIVLPEIRGDAA